jgi:hypothetical protein
MSKRRKPGEVVRRKPGSGFVGSASPEFVRVPDEPIEDWHPCILSCGDDDCREYENLEVVGEHDGATMCHISECQMEDVETPK